MSIAIAEPPARQRTAPETTKSLSAGVQGAQAAFIIFDVLVSTMTSKMINTLLR